MRWCGETGLSGRGRAQVELTGRGTLSVPPLVTKSGCSFPLGAGISSVQFTMAEPYISFMLGHTNLWRLKSFSRGEWIPAGKEPMFR